VLARSATVIGQRRASTYVAPFGEDAEAVLATARATAFRERAYGKAYARGEPKARSIAALIDACAEDGTCSIIDVVEIGDARAPGVAGPFSRELVASACGTVERTLEQIEAGASALYETLGRGPNSPTRFTCRRTASSYHGGMHRLVICVTLLACRRDVATPDPAAAAAAADAASTQAHDVLVEAGATTATTPTVRPHVDESARPTGPPCQETSDCPAHEVCCTVYFGRAMRHQCGKPGTTWSSNTPYEDRAKPTNIATTCPSK